MTLGDELGNMLERCLGAEYNAASFDTETVGAHLDLRFGFLAADVEDLTIGPDGAADLHEQCGLTDSGIAADKRHGSFDETSAEDTVELGNSGGETRFVLLGDLGKLTDTALGDPAGTKCGLGVRGSGFYLDNFIKCVIFLARRAFAHPAGCLVTAAAADEL